MSIVSSVVDSSVVDNKKSFTKLKSFKECPYSCHDAVKNSINLNPDVIFKNPTKMNQRTVIQINDQTLKYVGDKFETPNEIKELKSNGDLHYKIITTHYYPDITSFSDFSITTSSYPELTITDRRSTTKHPSILSILDIMIGELTRIFGVIKSVNVQMNNLNDNGEFARHLSKFGFEKFFLSRRNGEHFQGCAEFITLNFFGSFKEMKLALSYFVPFINKDDMIVRGSYPMLMNPEIFDRVVCQNKVILHVKTCENKTKILKGILILLSSITVKRISTQSLIRKIPVDVLRSHLYKLFF